MATSLVERRIERGSGDGRGRDRYISCVVQKAVCEL